MNHTEEAADKNYDNGNKITEESAWKNKAR